MACGSLKYMNFFEMVGFFYELDQIMNKSIEYSIIVQIVSNLTINYNDVMI